MPKKTIIYSAVCIISAILAGCGEASTDAAGAKGAAQAGTGDAARIPGKSAAAKAESAGTAAGGRAPCVMDRLSDGDVFMVVNGRKFTKHDFLVASSLEDKIRRFMAGDPLTGPNPKAEQAVLDSRRRTVSEMQRRALIRQFAQKNGVAASVKEYDEYCARLLKSMRNQKNIIALARKFGPEESRLFLCYVDDDALAQPLRNHFDKDGILKITDADIITVSNRWLRAVERTNASNEVELASMRAALAEVESGVLFEKAAEKYSERPEQGRIWGELMLEEMDDNPELKAWAENAGEGDVSRILGLDDGWSIVKVLKRRPEDLPPGSKALPREVWTFARITRRAFDTAKELPRDEIIQGLLDFRNKKIQKRIGDEIMASARIEWPFGENLFDEGARPAEAGAHPPEQR